VFKMNKIIATKSKNKLFTFGGTSTEFFATEYMKKKGIPVLNLENVPVYRKSEGSGKSSSSDTSASHFAGWEYQDSENSDYYSHSSTGRSWGRESSDSCHSSDCSGRSGSSGFGF